MSVRQQITSFPLNFGHAFNSFVTVLLLQECFLALSTQVVLTVGIKLFAHIYCIATKTFIH